MLAHWHAVRVQESHRIGLHPDKVISEPMPVCVDEVGGEGLSSGDDRGAVGLQDTVELLPHEVDVWTNIPVAVGDTIGWICENEVDGAVGNSLDAGFVVFKKDFVDEVFWKHEKRLSLYYTFVKLIYKNLVSEDYRSKKQFVNGSYFLAYFERMKRVALFWVHRVIRQNLAKKDAS
jgi:hypothetical protein